MSPRTRKLLFLSLTGAFFIIGTLVVLYAQGWRLDMRTLRARKVGALYIHTSPKNAEIFLDDKLIPRNFGFFSESTLINNLFPKNYRLLIKSPDYKDWQKTVAVSPAEVLEIKNAVLVPVFPKPATARPVEDFLIFPEGILTQNQNSLWLNDSKIAGNKIIARDNKQNLISYDTTQKAYYLNNLQNGTSFWLDSLFVKVGLGFQSDDKIILGANSDVILQKPNSLWLVEPLKPTAQRLTTTPQNEFVRSVSAAGSAIVWTVFDGQTNQSRLLAYDKISKTQKTIAILDNGPVAYQTWNDTSLLALVQENGDFYLYDTKSGEVKKIASDVRQVKFFGDKKVAALENHSLEIFSLRDDKYWRFNLPQVESAKNLEWYDDFHIFVHYPEETKLLSMEDGSLENFAVVAQTKTGYFEPESNKFYFLNNESIYYLQFAQD